MGIVARAPWDMLRRLHGTCYEGSMGIVTRAPWDMMCKDCMRHIRKSLIMGHVASVP